MKTVGEVTLELVASDYNGAKKEAPNATTRKQ
jgi:hypothetical protein